MTAVAAMQGVFARSSGTAQGMVLMLFSTVCFVCMQSMIRYVGETLPPFEVAFFRNLFGLVALTPIFLRQGLRPLKTRKLHLHAARGVIQSSGMLAFFTGVTLIPLAQTTALSFSAPLFATLLAILVLGERVRIRRITALALGFCGMLLVVRPGFAELNLGTILIICSSLTWGTAIAIIKSMSKTESSATLTVYMGLFLTPITGVFAFFVWQNPSWEQLGWLFAIGCLGTLGHLSFAQSFRKAESTAVLPLDFTRLIWASAVGFLVWQEIPDAWAWIGGSVIFGSATYIAYREARLARAAKAAA
ncbi:MAG: DMT family transporter [Alphaproteobacteria bacterium]|nr:DMT family transporter [Alphaproteobacteria bacterium]MCB9930567.1 DMT family transporter [Alphaproteobacteria bacterium]